MKQTLSAYTFDASAKTVALDDLGTVRLDRLLLITNVTRNVIIYQFNRPSLGGSVATNVVSLVFDTTSHADTDKLLIHYDLHADDNLNDDPPAPLSPNAATATKQDVGNTTLTSIDTHVDGLETLVAATNAALATIDTHVDGLEAQGTTANGHLQTIETSLGAPLDVVLDISTLATQATLATIDTHVDGLETLVTATNTKLDTLHADVASVDTHVDGLETLVTATNTKLDTIDTHVDGLEGLLTTIDSHVDGLETLVGATNSTLITIDSHVDGLEASSTSLVTATGATTDAAVTTDANGTVTGFLRGLVKWAAERMPASLGTKTAAASLPVALAATGSTIIQNLAASATGVGTALDVTGMSQLMAMITVSASATIVPQVSVDGGATWASFSVFSVAGPATATTTINNSATVTGQVAGATHVRFNCTANTGAVTVTANAVATGARPLERIQSQGLAATGSAVTGNPNLVGGYDGTNARNLRTAADNADALAVNATAEQLRSLSEGMVFNGTTWDRARTASSASSTTGTGLPGVGNLNFDGTNWQVQRSEVDNADGVAVSAGLNKLVAMARNMLFNGTSYDRQRANTTSAVVAAGTTTTQTNIALTTYNARGLVLLVNITAGAGSLVVAINGTTVSSYVYNILTSASLSGAGNVAALHIFPGAAAVANSFCNDVLPRNVTITATVTGSITYGIDAILGV